MATNYPTSVPPAVDPTEPPIYLSSGTSREEITKVLTNVSENGTIRGRVMYSSPTYRLTLVHNLLEPDIYAYLIGWLEDNYDASDITVVWSVDGETYEGIIEKPPEVSYEAEYKRHGVTVALLVKKTS